MDALKEKLIRFDDERDPVHFESLMTNRVRNILLVSSLYDSFTFEEDGRLNEVLISEYMELNLRYAPYVERVSTAEEAFAVLQERNFDLIISMVRVGGMDVLEFAKRCKAMIPHVPIILLTYHTRELPVFEEKHELPGIDRRFAWHGDVRLFLAIIKSIEDRMNVEHDVLVADVQCIILIEDSVSFYSSYLPMLYTELVRQTRNLMSEGLNRMERYLRTRARPKLLLATSYEEGRDLYRKLRNNVLGVITDVGIPRNGTLDDTAGLDFAKEVREEIWDRAVLVQSSDEGHREAAHKVGAKFLNKNSPRLLWHVKKFMRENLGFGDFVFRTPDEKVIASASDLHAFANTIHEIPDESLIYHITRNHFSLWLMARTEFDLAKALRPLRIPDFKDIHEIREFLVRTLNTHLEARRSGVVADFSRDTFSPESLYVRIGDGSLGGKGRGLAFIHKLLNRIDTSKHVPDVRIFVPPTTVLTTEIFEQFMDFNELRNIAIEEPGDEKITRLFLEAELPQTAVDQLELFLDSIHYPLAVRSSSLQEDASHQPFAGLYRTYMLANDDENMDVRLMELVKAVKLVYASTYYNDPRSYFEATPNRLEEEQMAILIQEVVGRRHGQYIYPDISGVARSYDYYPMVGRDPEDGVVSIALGLGKQVVDGGRAVRFSPSFPDKLYQFSTVEDILDSSQREFFALDMSLPGPSKFISSGGDSNIVQLGLDAAEKHGTLNLTGSTYVPENDAVYDGTSRDGIRLVTMAGVLKHNRFPLASAIKFLLKLGQEAFSAPVEIEFAANMKEKDHPPELGFLQIRPMVIGSDTFDLKLDAIDTSHAICVSHNALGQATIQNVYDIMYVKPDRFDRNKTIEIAREIESINSRLRDEDRRFVIIGPGRWGTSDRFFGIPVNWSQISRVALFIETDIQGVSVEPSQGTHFFHNITSMGIPYLTIDLTSSSGLIDYDWLNSQNAFVESEHVRLIRFDEKLEIAVDGKKRQGVIMKPGRSLRADS